MSDSRVTYILANREYDNRRYYVGITENIERRMKEHSKETMYKNHKLILTIVGDFEKKIKAFGVKAFVEAIGGVTLLP